MPHIIVKLWPGRTKEVKQNVSKKIAQLLMEELDSSDKSISIDFVEIPKEKWMDEVYNKDISPKIDKLTKKPGYIDI